MPHSVTIFRAKIGRLHDVIGGTRGDFVVPEDNLFRHASAHADDQVGLDLIASEWRSGLFPAGASPCPECATARDDRGLVDRIRSRRMDCRQGVPASW